MTYNDNNNIISNVFSQISACDFLSAVFLFLAHSCHVLVVDSHAMFRPVFIFSYTAIPMNMLT